MVKIRGARFPFHGPTGGCGRGGAFFTFVVNEAAQQSGAIERHDGHGDEVRGK
jgi:hypothetical protein